MNIPLHNNDSLMVQTMINYLNTLTSINHLVVTIVIPSEVTTHNIGQMGVLT